MVPKVSKHAGGEPIKSITRSGGYVLSTAHETCYYVVQILVAHVFLLRFVLYKPLTPLRTDLWAHMCHPLHKRVCYLTRVVPALILTCTPTSHALL